MSTNLNGNGDEYYISTFPYPIE